MLCTRLGLCTRDTAPHPAGVFGILRPYEGGSCSFVPCVFLHRALAPKRIFLLCVMGWPH